MSRVLFYVLADDGRTPVGVSDPFGFARDRNAARVALTTRDGVEVSTVFLYVDHQFGTGPPLLWETMVFGGQYDGDQRRYSTYDEAAAGHAEMCRRVFGDEPTERRGMSFG